MAAYRDLYLTQGDDFSEIVTLTNPDGTFVNLFGSSFFSQAKMSLYSNTVSVNFTCAISDQANGNVTMSVNSATTSNLAAGEYFYDMTQVNPANLTSHILSGLLIVVPGATNITPPNEGIPAL